MNHRAFSLPPKLISILLGVICCAPVKAELIPITGGGNFNVTAKKQDVIIAGKLVHAMIYEDDNNPLGVPVYSNGIPILVMRLTVGQMVTCRFTNKLPNGEVPEGASIHWHGIELDNDSDGTSVTQDSILQDQSYLYRFVATRPGMFWFHSHMVPGDTLFAGMYGVIIIQSPCEAQLIATNGLPGPSATWTLAMSDIEFLSASFTNTSGATGMVSQAGSVGRVANGQFQTINKWIHDCGNNGAGQGPCGTGSNPGNTVLVNGYNPDATKPPLTFPVMSGQTIRLQLLNEALTRSFYLKLEPTNSQQLFRIGGQGGLLNNARLEGGVQNGWNTLYDPGAIVISSGMRADVVTQIPAGLSNGTILTLWGEPLRMPNSQWPLMAQITNPYPIAYFTVTGPVVGANPIITNGSPLLTGANCMVPNLTNGAVNIKTNFINPAPYVGSSSGQIRLTQAVGGNTPSIDNLNLIIPANYPNGNPLDGNLGDGTVWQTPPLPTSRYANLGDLFILSVKNETGNNNPLAHPFHLHGFSFQPLAMVDGGGAHPFGYNEFLDTLDVYSGQSLVFSVRLDDRPKYCDAAPSFPALGGPMLAPCSAAASGGGLGRWLFHCHIAAHGVLGMMGEVVVLPVQWPELNTNGVDVQASKGTGSQTVADDFRLPSSGYVTDVHFWGSWLNDAVDTNVTFEVKFWTDVPAAGGKPSRPGWQAWWRLFPPGGYASTLVASNINNERFFDPSQTNLVATDTKVYRYDFVIPTNQAFFASASNLYWMSVTAQTTNGALFGWKTCLTNYHFSDDATWSATLLGPHWSDLHYPSNHPYAPQSMDMAFALNSGVPGAPPPPPPPLGGRSAAPELPVLSATASDGGITISWEGGGTLQYADELEGPWYDISNATSPCVTAMTGPHRFYRVRVP